MDVTNEPIKRTTIDDLLNSAHEHGEYSLFLLDNVSYYPTKKAQDKISWGLYGVPANEFYFGVERYIKLKERSNRAPPHISRPFAHTDVEGSFMILKSLTTSPRGILNLTNILDKYFPEVNLALVSDNALYPNVHHIDRFSAGNPPRIYTVDQDGSRWSLHGSFKN